jgi:hypothetical protein
MGEKIRVISEINFKGASMDIELNAGSAMAKYPLHIHIQNDHFRFDITEEDYLRMAIAVCAGKKILMENKEIAE